MPDRYQQIVTSSLGRRLAELVGLPTPTPLRRYEPGQSLLVGPALIGGGGRLLDAAAKLLVDADAEILEEVPADAEARLGGLVFDATGIVTSAQLEEVFEFLHGSLRQLGRCGRVVVLATPPALTASADERVAQRALEGLVRSLGKELRGGATANLIEVAPGADAGLDAPLRFVLSARSAYVSGQRITVGRPTAVAPQAPADVARPLDGEVAVVTGAARGIGAEIARVLARDGASVVCLDLPAAGESLAAIANEVGGSALQVDITADDAPERLAEHLGARHHGVDVVVHNAGITRDKTMAGMDERRWRSVIDVNLRAMERIDAHLLDGGVLRGGGRIVCVSSMSGIAGNRGQTNYAASKAGVIGHVESLATALADLGGTINAVAPGFIETEMTDAMPLGVREVGRRISSLGQGGKPVDVAETIAFFAAPDATWVNGTTLRVCGQNLLGA